MGTTTPCNARYCAIQCASAPRGSGHPNCCDLCNLRGGSQPRHRIRVRVILEGSATAHRRLGLLNGRLVCSGSGLTNARQSTHSARALHLRRGPLPCGRATIDAVVPSRLGSWRGPLELRLSRRRPGLLLLLWGVMRGRPLGPRRPQILVAVRKGACAASSAEARLQVQPSAQWLG